jgi:hypothetical protein
MSPDEFRQLLRSDTDEAIVSQVILARSPGVVIDNDALSFLEGSARSMLSLEASDTLTAVVVGSAKLGFSIVEKSAGRGKPFRPAFRAFQPGVSDIDVAIVSPIVYGRIWQELAAHAARQTHFPMDGMLPRYMASGWLRPDHFPRPALARTRRWDDWVRHASKSTHFRLKRLRCALYQSMFFLAEYQQRGVRAARESEAKA